LGGTKNEIMPTYQVNLQLIGFIISTIGIIVILLGCFVYYKIRPEEKAQNKIIYIEDWDMTSKPVKIIDNLEEVKELEKNQAKIWSENNLQFKTSKTNPR